MLTEAPSSAHALASDPPNAQAWTFRPRYALAMNRSGTVILWRHARTAVGTDRMIWFSSRPTPES